MLSSVSEFRFMILFVYTRIPKRRARVPHHRACLHVFREKSSTLTPEGPASQFRAKRCPLRFVQIFSIADTFGAEFPFDYVLIMHLLAAGPAPAARRALHLL